MSSSTNVKIIEENASSEVSNVYSAVEYFEKHGLTNAASGNTLAAISNGRKNFCSDQSNVNLIGIIMNNEAQHIGELTGEFISLDRLLANSLEV